jgi:hypothetical protein
MLAWTMVVFAGRTSARAARVGDHVWKIDEIVALLADGQE